MEKIYIYSNGGGFLNTEPRGFTEIEIPSFEGYETMVSTANDIVTILDSFDFKKKNECLEKTFACIDTLAELEKYYKGNEVFVWNIKKAKTELELNVAYNTGVNGKRNWVNRWNCNMVRDLANGVVRFSDSKGKDYGKRYWHIFNLIGDTIEYNGKKFYMWDGWHSSYDVMKEIADKQFNA